MAPYGESESLALVAREGVQGGRLILVVSLNFYIYESRKWYDSLPVASKNSSTSLPGQLATGPHNIARSSLTPVPVQSATSSSLPIPTALPTPSSPSVNSCAAVSPARSPSSSRTRSTSSGENSRWRDCRPCRRSTTGPWIVLPRSARRKGSGRGCSEWPGPSRVGMGFGGHGAAVGAWGCGAVGLWWRCSCSFVRQRGGERGWG